MLDIVLTLAEGEKYFTMGKNDHSSIYVSLRVSSRPLEDTEVEVL